MYIEISELKYLQIISAILSDIVLITEVDLSIGQTQETLQYK